MRQVSCHSVVSKLFDFPSNPGPSLSSLLLGNVVGALCAFSFALHLSMPIIMLPCLIVVLAQAQAQKQPTVSG